MWKAAFSGRSDTGSVSGRPSTTRKKSSGSSRKPEEESRRSGKSSRGSTYGDDDDRSTYATAPSSRIGEPRSLTESAVQMLENDEEDWEDDDRDARSERKSVRSEGRKHRRKSEKERTRSRSPDKSGKHRTSSRKDSETARLKSRRPDEGDERALPDMGSFEQFPGQYSGGVMGGGQEPMMSGALPSPNNQFGLSRAESYGAAAEYYLDEGQSVTNQPGIRASTPNMRVNTDPHLMAPSAEAHPAQDTGHGSAADFYGGEASAVLTEEPQSISTSKPSSSSRPSKSGKTSSYGSAAAATAAGIGLGAVAGSTSSYHHSQNQSSSTSYQQTSSSSSRPYKKPTRHNTDPVTSGSNGRYYAPPPGQGSNSRPTGKQPSSSNAGLYAAGAAAAGLAAYEMNQNHQQHSTTPSISPYGGTAYAQPTTYGRQQGASMNGSMQQQHQHFHEHKGPMTRLKDGLFNLISSEEDTIKMEMYTEYIGVCKYCFDPRSSPYDAPRRHHYHDSSRRDSFEDLRKRRSIDKMRRSSREQLGRTGSTRVDKDSRYYPERRKSSSKTDLVGAGLAAAGVAAGANALFNSDRRDFDDTYSVKSGYREGSSARRRSRSSSREKRLTSSYGVTGRESKEDYVTVRTADGRIEKRRVHRSRSRSGDRTSTLVGTAAGAALGASAIGAANRSRRSRNYSPNGAFVRRRSRSGSSSGSQRGGIFSNFFSPPRRKRRGSRPERRKKEQGFFSFGNGSAVSSDSELAFGASRTDLSLRRKSSAASVNKRKKSNTNIAATVAGIGATAAALAAAQNGQRIGKRSSRPELGPGRVEKKRQIARKQGKQSADDDEWEDELPSDVDDASSVGSDLAFGDYDRKLSRRQSRESVGSQSSGAGGLGAWGWRWGSKDKKRRRKDSRPPAYSQRPESSGLGSAVAGAALGTVAGAAIGSSSRPTRADSTYTSTSSVPQQPMQYVDPRPLSDAGSLSNSRHASMPGAFDDVRYVATARPGPGPIQQPKPVTPIKPAFTQDLRDFDDPRPMPRRTQSSPVQKNWVRDAALIGAAAVGTAAVIASQGRKSKDVRFGFTEEQERKHDDERRREQERSADEERRVKDRERAVKEEAARATREQDVLRQRAAENKRAAEAELERQRAVEREAQEQAEIQARKDRERREREEAYNRAREERERREREEARLSEEIERKKHELEDQQRRDREREEQQRRDRKRGEQDSRDRDRRTQERRSSESQSKKQSEDSASSDIPWAAAAVAGAAGAAGVGSVAYSERDRRKDERRNSKGAEKSSSRDAYVAQEITPPAVRDDNSFQDDALEDPDYFKRQRSRSPTEHARHVDDLARKAAAKVKSASKVMAENESYYAEPARSQADFFAPEEILASRSEGKTKVADPTGDNSVAVYNAADLEKRRQFGMDWGGTFAKPTSYAPRGVPHLDLITPTPPPEVMSKSRRSWTEPAPSANAAREDDDLDRDSAKKSARSRSISWGVDQTHVYDVPTPDSHIERDSYIQSEDIPKVTGASAAGVAAAAVAGAALYGANDDSTYSRSDSSKRSYGDDGQRPDIKAETSGARDTSSTYRQPFYDSVSDIGVFAVDSPGTEGAPPVRGYVEGEVVVPTPANEKVPHIPGGFDDDYDEPGSTARRETSTSFKDSSEVKPAAEEEDAWAPPLSKKDKKKRDKAAKKSSTLDDLTTSTPPKAVVEPTSREPVAQPEDDLDYFMSKKDKKKRDKGVKRSSTFDDYATSVATQGGPEPAASQPQSQPDDDLDYFMSKKDKKKRDKALSRSVSEAGTSDATITEPSEFDDKTDTATRDVEPEVEPAWEPPLSKKDKKKREKEAKKQGFADVAGSLMTAGGIAAVAAAVADDSSPAESPSSKKGKKGKKSREVERDIRDIEPAETVTPAPDVKTSAERQSSGMPGGWDSDGQVPSPADVVDPFQFQVHDDPPSTAAAAEVDPSDEFADVKSKKKSKKRDSLKFSEPSTSSPLKSEVRADEDTVKTLPPAETSSHTNGNASMDLRDMAAAAGANEAADAGRSARSTKYAIDERPSDGRRRIVSPDDLRSVVSDPTGDRKSRMQDKDEPETSRSPYAAEPDAYDDARSTAASEPVDPYEQARKSKRRSRREDDDTASVVSSRSRRERDEPSSKDKRTGFFGLFGRKSWDNVPRTDDTSLSRQSTREGKDEDPDDAERKHRRRKHRSSEYGDDDDTRSVVSSSSRKHRSRSERDEESRDRYADDSYSTRNGDDGERHHLRRRTDDDGTSVSGEKRHHHRRRTDEETYDKDQSFLGMRVEDMPPLPDSDDESQEPATQILEQGDGNLASADPTGTHHTDREHADAFGLIRQDVDDRGTTASAEIGQLTAAPGFGETRDHSTAFDYIRQGHHDIEPPTSRDVGVAGKHLSWSDEINYFPALPESRPGSPTVEILSPGPLERPTTLQRPTSMTTVPLRFPFGNQPVTPTQRMERAASFGGSLPSTPATTSSQKPRQGRPGSTEFRPLYLVERNRKTPEVEDLLPSLPSSKPSSRASSMVGSDEYESAVEDVGSPERRRDLLIDTSFANRNWEDEEYLDSQQTTPKATHRPEIELEKRPRQQPQFYTWEDYARDERMHDEGQTLSEGPSQPATFHDSRDYAPPASSRYQPEEEELPALPPSRPSSRTARPSDTNSAKGVLAAAALGGAAVLGYHALQQKDEPESASFNERNATVDNIVTEVAKEGKNKTFSTENDRPSNATSTTSKKPGKKNKKGKKGKQIFEPAWEDAGAEAPSTNVLTVPRDGDDFDTAVRESTAEEGPFALLSRDTDKFIADENIAEEGIASGPTHQDAQASMKEPSEVDRFIDQESQLEAGGPASREVSDAFNNGADEREEVPFEPAIPARETSQRDNTFLGQSSGAVDDADVTDTKPASPERKPGEEVENFLDAEQRVEAVGGVASREEQLDTQSRDQIVDASVREAEPSRDFEEDATTIAPPLLEENEPPSDPFTFAPSRKQSKKEKRKQQKASRQATFDDTIDQITDPAQSTHVEQSDTKLDDAVIPPPMPITTVQTVALPALTQATSRDSIPLPGSPSLKSGASVSTSTTAAHMSTTMEPATSEAAKRLSMSLREASPASSTMTNDVKDEPAVKSEGQTTTSTAAERPILRPEDSWVGMPTLSRKQSKKDKKKQRQAVHYVQETEDFPTEAETLVVEEQKETESPAAGDKSSLLYGDNDALQTETTQQRTDVEEIRPENIALPVGLETELDESALQEDEVRPEEVALPAGLDTDIEDESALKKVILNDPMDYASHSASQLPTALDHRSDDAALLDDTSTEAIIEPVQDPKSSDAMVDDEPADEISAKAMIEEQPEPKDDPAGEFTWAMSSKKKGKKGRKGKTSEMIEDPVSVEITSTVQTPRETSDEVEDGVDLSQREAPAADMDNDTWASFSTKKKGRKGTRKNTGTPGDVTPKEMEPTLKSIVETSALVEEGKEQAETSQSQPEATAVADDDMWASFSTKKKKGKKSKKTESSGDATVKEVEPTLDTTTETPFAEEQEKQAEFSQSQPESTATAADDEDVWASFSSKKKKGKKGKKTDTMDDPIEVETEPNRGMVSEPLAVTEEAPAQAEGGPAQSEEALAPPEETLARPEGMATATENDPATIEDDVWPSFSSKKKGKKARKSETLENLPSAETEPTHGLSSEPLAATENAAIAAEDQTATPVDDAGASFSTKKRNKKGMKSEPEEIEEPTSKDVEAVAEQTEIIPAPATDANDVVKAGYDNDDIWAAFPTKKAKGKKGKKGSAPVAFMGDDQDALVPEPKTTALGDAVEHIHDVSDSRNALADYKEEEDTPFFQPAVAQQAVDEEVDASTYEAPAVETAPPQSAGVFETTDEAATKFHSSVDMDDPPEAFVDAHEVADPTLDALGNTTQETFSVPTSQEIDMTASVDSPAQVVDEPREAESEDVASLAKPPSSTALPPGQQDIDAELADTSFAPVDGHQSTMRDGPETQPSFDSADASTVEPVQAALEIEPEPESFWALTSSKKKSKKGKKSKSVFGMPDDLSDRVQTDAAATSAGLNDTVSSDPEVTEPGRKLAAVPADDEWAPPVKGRKGRKTKSVFGMLEKESDRRQDDSAAAAESTRLNDIAEPVQDVTAVPADDEWTPPVKGKKGKKAKKATKFDESAFEVKPPRQIEDADVTEVASTQPTSEPATPQTGPSDIDSTDAWATSAKTKNGKKGKKGKRTTLNLFTKDDTNTAESNERELAESNKSVDSSVFETAEDVLESQSTARAAMDPTSELPSATAMDIGIQPSSQDLDDATLPLDTSAHHIRSSDGDSRATGLVGDAFSYNDLSTRMETDQYTGDTVRELGAMAPSTGMSGNTSYQEEPHDSSALTKQTEALPAHNPDFDAMEEAASVPLPEEMDVDELAEAYDIPELNSPTPEEHGDYADQTQERRATTPEEQQQRDFTEDITSGLTESGFNPDDFIQNPAFQRRSSPPGMVAEAVPEEVFATSGKSKKKGKKGKKSFTPFEPEPEDTEALAAPTPAAGLEVDPPQAPANDEFNDILDKSLTGTGINTAMLDRVVASSNDASSNELTGDNAEFSFSTSKRKKGRKGKKSQPSFFDLTEDSHLDQEQRSIVEQVGDADHEAMTDSAAQVERGVGANDDQETSQSLRGEADANTEQRNPPNVVVEDLASPFAVSGDREMDIDEMDIQYKNMKKNNKNKKKQRAMGATTVEPTPDEAPSSLTAAIEDYSMQPTEEQDRKQSVPQVDEPSHSSSLLPPAKHENSSSERDLRRHDETETANAGRQVPSFVAAAAGLSTAAAAAAGLEHVIRKKRSGGRSPREDASPASSERSLGLLPMDRHGKQSIGPSWSFENLNEGGTRSESPLADNKIHEIARDSGYQEADESIRRREASQRDSQDSPAIRHYASHGSLSSRRSAEPLHISTDDANDWNLKASKTRAQNSMAGDDSSKSLHARTPSRETNDTPLESTTKNRASYLFQTTPEIMKDMSASPGSPTPRERDGTRDYFERTETTSSRDRQPDPVEATPDRMTFSPPPSGTLSPRPALDTIPEEQQALKRTITETDAVPPDNTKAIRRTQTPQTIRVRERALSPTSNPPLAIQTNSNRSVSEPLSTDELLQRLPWPAVDDENSSVNIDRKRPRQVPVDQRSTSVVSNRSNTSAGQMIRSPEELRSFSRTSNRSSTPTLRRISLSGDLRAASRRGDSGSAVGARSSPKTIPFEPPPTPPSNDDEVMDGGASRSADMSDVFQGVGGAQGSQVSPTRPPSMRKRQSMHIMELENRLGQLAAENQALHESQQSRGISSDNPDYTNSRDVELQEKHHEIQSIRAMLQPMQDEVARLTEINAGLTEANRTLVDDSNSRYAALQEQHNHAQEQWQSSTRDLDDMRQEHDRLNSGMRDIVETEIANRLLDKNAEIRQLREELDEASEKIRALQVQIQATRGRDFLSNRDEDYFDGACQKLCQHVQQWVLRFSKMSDKLVCRLSSDLKDDKIEARLDNAILDGSDVDKLLADRIKRRDVFMSVVMTMVWEYIFTRYLFGLDREQRQKLKALQKLLAEVGPPRAVAQWRATTLTLLAKRPAFAEQKNLDTEAVAQEIFALLCALLPPPSSAKEQLYASLLKVITIAVDLSIEMHTQRAEFIMLPPLQPEYDLNGDLVRKVHFNALLMNERSGMFSSNEQLEESNAVVKIVLFPLVVKKGDEVGEGEEEIVVCPAQVLVHNDKGKGKKIVRVQSGGITMDVDDPRQSRQSLISAQGSTMF